MGNNKYPRTVTAAHNLLVSWEGTLMWYKGHQMMVLPIQQLEKTVKKKCQRKKEIYLCKVVLKY
eukprot:7070891-Ditylum_brightwellii.AAC.1